VTAADEVRAAVDAETRAWDVRDVDLLLDLFHPDMVWPWPPDADTHDPADWTWGMGRFDRSRWRRIWQDLFDSHELVHNRRETVRISVAPDGEGAFAVVDVDTLWRDRDSGTQLRWLGRACKVYALVGGSWKLIMHTGLLAYPVRQAGVSGAAGSSA
jgi:ketosteroid isomerase-like protein